MGRNVERGEKMLFMFTKETLHVLMHIVDENSPRECWPLTRVLKALPGDDGRVRASEVRTKSDTLNSSDLSLNYAYWRVRLPTLQSYDSSKVAATKVT